MTKFKLNTDSWGYFLVNEVFYIKDKKTIVQNAITFTNSQLAYHQSLYQTQHNERTLVPRSKLTPNQLKFIYEVLKEQTSDLKTYTPYRIKTTMLLLPMTINATIDVDYMEKYMAQFQKVYYVGPWQNIKLEKLFNFNEKHDNKIFINRRTHQIGQEEPDNWNEKDTVSLSCKNFNLTAKEADLIIDRIVISLQKLNTKKTWKIFELRKLSINLPLTKENVPDLQFIDNFQKEETNDQ